MVAANRRIVVSHPGRQHSHQMARALYGSGLLERYFHGVPRSRLEPVPLLETGDGGEYPEYWSKATCIPLSPITRRVAERLLTRKACIDWTHRSESWFDWVVSKRVGRVRPSVVICYENAALYTFAAAKRIGAITVLDAASVHHSMQDEYFSPEESARVHRRIVQRKNAEIDLADFVLCTSRLAKESYVRSGVSEERVYVCNMGFDEKVFFQEGLPSSPPPLRFAYVGNANPLKGLDLLDNAAKHLRGEGFDFTVSMVGGKIKGSCIIALDRMEHAQLAKWLRGQHVLVLPSRFDSFGMVVVEAMACGVPVLASDKVGACELIQHCKNGYIFPAGDEVGLAKGMRWFCERGAQLKEISDAALDCVKGRGWRDYRFKIVETLRNLASQRSAQTVPGMH